MNLPIFVLAVLCGLLLVVSLVLFLMTALRRHKLDSALKRAAALNMSSADEMPQLGMFTPWRSATRVALAPPERRWTYDQDYMIAFIGALRSQDVLTGSASASPAGGSEAESPALDYYRRSILGLDLAFAVVFAAFIVCAAFLAAEWLAGLPWLGRACVICACMGVVYGVADVAEDIKLRRILDYGEKVATSKRTGEPSQSDPAEADAAEVDAASALTRVKLVSILLSLIGFAVFAIFLGLGAIVTKLSAPTSSDPNSGVSTSDHVGPARPSLGAPAAT